ncbi:Prespore-specific transcriptional regulator RsfA [compost metagenome]
MLTLFDEAADKLHPRTAAAVGYRWHSKLSRENKELYQQAKNQGVLSKKNQNQEPSLFHDEDKEQTHNLVNEEQEENNPTANEQLKAEEQNQVQDTSFEIGIRSPSEVLQVKNFVENAVNIYKQNEELIKENEELRNRLRVVEQQRDAYKQDNEAYLNVFNKARQLSVTEELGSGRNTSTFKMERNGNLERR